MSNVMVLYDEASQSDSATVIGQIFDESAFDVYVGTNKVIVDLTLIPATPEPKAGYDAILNVNLTVDPYVFSYKYIQRPLTQTEIVDDLRQQNQQLLTQVEALSAYSVTSFADSTYKALDLTNTPLSDVQNAKIAQLNEACKNTILSGFTSKATGHTYSTSLTDQLNWVGEYAKLSQDTTIISVEWGTTDAGVVTHTRADWIAAYLDGESWKQAQINHYRSLKSSTLAATSNSGIDAINWTPATY